MPIFENRHKLCQRTCSSVCRSCILYNYFLLLRKNVSHLGFCPLCSTYPSSFFYLPAFVCQPQIFCLKKLVLIFFGWAEDIKIFCFLKNYFLVHWKFKINRNHKNNCDFMCLCLFSTQNVGISGCLHSKRIENMNPFFFHLGWSRFFFCRS